MPSVFIRFGKCNPGLPVVRHRLQPLRHHDAGRHPGEGPDILGTNVIITGGGEPTIQPHLERLLDCLKAEGHFLAIETNGLKPVPPQIDYIATSPKRLYQRAYVKRHIKFAHEVRIVVMVTCATSAPRSRTASGPTATICRPARRMAG